MNMKSELSIDVSDFKKLIKRNKIYVDKTEVIKRMRELNGTYHFLSRPRRFGKSLLISILKELFEGNKKLFKDTYIYNHWNWDETYPVIHLDFNNIGSETREILEESLSHRLDKIAKNFGVELESNNLIDKFSDLIEEVHDTHKKNVVVLVDEYDKPILDNIDNIDIAKANQKILKNFHGVLKSLDGVLEFVFITGITQFSKLSIFSGFNNLKDLTLKGEYSTICGYTQEELEKYFKEFIVNYANLKNIDYKEVINKIKYHYDGYSWDGNNFLYNPYSLMNFFDDDEFNNYWFESGTPNFLVKIFKKNFNIGHVYNPIKLYESELNIFDIENIKQIPLLFQSGYLTIMKKEIINDEIAYTLKIPNFEVETSITRNLLENFYTKTENSFRAKRKEILNELKDGRCDLLVRYLKKEIMNIHYQLKIRNWRYYQTLIYFAIKGLDIQTESEVGMFSGRMDIIIEEKDDNYSFTDDNGHSTIIELKYTQMKDKNIETLAKVALNQIKEKEYYEKYGCENVTMIGLAIKEIKLKIGSRIDIACKIKNHS